MRQELEKKDGAYELENRSLAEILATHTEFLKSLHLPVEEKVPSLFALPKMHKSPPGWRFIAGSAECSVGV